MLATATILGLVPLWPSRAARSGEGFVISSSSIRAATVTAVAAASCPAEQAPGCQRVDLNVEYAHGLRIKGNLYLPGDEASPRLSVGDEIRVADQTAVRGLPQTAPPADPSQAPTGSSTSSAASRCSCSRSPSPPSPSCSEGRVGAVSLLGAAAGLFLVTALRDRGRGCFFGGSAYTPGGEGGSAYANFAGLSTAGIRYRLSCEAPSSRARTVPRSTPSRSRCSAPS